MKLKLEAFKMLASELLDNITDKKGIEHKV